MPEPQVTKQDIDSFLKWYKSVTSIAYPIITPGGMPPGAVITKPTAEMLQKDPSYLYWVSLKKPLPIKKLTTEETEAESKAKKKEADSAEEKRQLIAARVYGQPIGYSQVTGGMIEGTPDEILEAKLEDYYNRLDYFLNSIRLKGVPESMIAQIKDQIDKYVNEQTTAGQLYVEGLPYANVFMNPDPQAADIEIKRVVDAFKSWQSDVADYQKATTDYETSLKAYTQGLRDVESGERWRGEAVRAAVARGEGVPGETYMEREARQFRTSAGALPEELQPAPPRDIGEPTPGSVEYQKFLETLPDEQRKFFAGRMGEVTAGLGDAETLRSDWWKALNQLGGGGPEQAEVDALRAYKKHYAALANQPWAGQTLVDEPYQDVRSISSFAGIYPDEKETYTGEVTGTPPMQYTDEYRQARYDVLKQLGATQERLAEVEAKGGSEPLERPGATRLRKDPLVAYLEQYPFLQKFLSRSPRERGFYPGSVAPPARWFS